MTNKTQILHDFYINATDSDHSEFLETHDLGIPLAVALTQGLVTIDGITEEGWRWINMDYDALLEHLGVDKDEFSSYSELMEIAGYE